MAKSAQSGVLIVSHESRVSLLVAQRLGSEPPKARESCSCGRREGKGGRLSRRKCLASAVSSGGRSLDVVWGQRKI